MQTAALLLLAIVASAQTAEQNLRKHVEYLASDKLEGRRTGEQGATDAAAYVAKEFAKYKLKPGYRASKPAFLQPFPYVAGVTLGEICNVYRAEMGEYRDPGGY